MMLVLAWALAADPEEPTEHTVGPGGTPIAEVPTAPVGTRPGTDVVAALLATDRAALEKARTGVEALYRRDYGAAKQTFDALAQERPGSGMGPLGNVLLNQAFMFENFDFRTEKPYEYARKQTWEQLDRGGDEAGDEALEAFVAAAMAGVEAIHTVRKGEYVAALGRGLEAMGSLERCRKRAPGFPDLLLGDGMYAYWKTVVARASPLIPDGEDRRAAGIAAMQKAEAQAYFLGPGATLGLAYAFIEERAWNRAHGEVKELRAAYPDNVIVAMTHGRVLTSLRRHPEALAVYDHVLRVDPKNQRTHYFRGQVLARMGRRADAEAAYRTYLAFEGLLPEYRAQTLYRLAALREREADIPGAIALYRQSAAVNGHKGARRALERLGAK